MLTSLLSPAPSSFADTLGVGSTFRHARYLDGDGKPALCTITAIDDSYVTYRLGTFGRQIKSARDTFTRSVADPSDT